MGGRTKEEYKMEHCLKTINPYFNDVKSGNKTFEIRKNDRDFKVGDLLLLQEYHRGEFTGEAFWRVITYVLSDAEQFGLKDGYVILGIKEEK
jgi:hypothetical protein